MAVKFRVFDVSKRPEVEVTDTIRSGHEVLAAQRRNEGWCRELIYCDIEGWAIHTDGTLILLDECGNFAYAPPSKYRVRGVGGREE